MSNQLLVSDFMDKQFDIIRENDSINEAISLLMKDRLIGLLVVNDQGNLVGTLSEKNCLEIYVHQTYHTLPSSKVKEHMNEIKLTVHSSMPAEEVADIVLEHKIRRLPVVDDGQLVGQVTRRDLLRGIHYHLFPPEVE